MQKIGFLEALERIVAEDPRYHRDAYIFLRDALDHTLKQQKRRQGEGPRHVTGQELLAGVREHALQEFGPMVPTIFSFWGIQETEDFGKMVFKLVDAGVFGKTENDSLDDFQGGYSFYEAFVEPFLPQKRLREGVNIKHDETKEVDPFNCGVEPGGGGAAGGAGSESGING